MDELILKLGDNTVFVQQDDNGRYSLNDLFRASGSKDKDKPARFLTRNHEIKVVKTWESTGEKNVTCEIFDKTVYQVKINRATVTFAPVEIVYKYASFISKEFEDAVYKAFSLLAKGSVSDAANIASSVAIPPEIVALHKHLYKKLMSDISEAFPTEKHAHSNFNRLLCKASTGYTPSELTGGYQSAVNYVKEHGNLPAINALIASIETIILLLKAGVKDYHAIAMVLKVSTTKNKKDLISAL